jgi:hypothetical protein
VFGLIFERLLLCLESVAHARGPNRPVPAGARRDEETRIGFALIDWLVTEVSAGTELRENAAVALGRTWGFGLDLGSGLSDGSLGKQSRDYGNKQSRDGNSDADATDGMDGTKTDGMDGARLRIVLDDDDETRYSLETGRTTISQIRLELRKRRVTVKTRVGNDPSRDWPIHGASDCGLLECLLRPSVLFCLPEPLMERCTTLLLTLLFVPWFKTKFGTILVRHYDAAARFPETLPWPGVGHGRGIGGQIDETIDGRRDASSDNSGDDASNDTSLDSASEFSAAAYAASESVGSEPNSSSRALTAYASRRQFVSRCLDRVTVQVFGAAPVRVGAFTKS